ncbi:MAG: phosphomannomutase [Acidobacteriota bacterium]
MQKSGVKFGTSGARGLASDMTDRICCAYTYGFLQYLESVDDVSKGQPVAVAGDLRPSTERIMSAVATAISNSGYTPINCGRIPSPAVALKGLKDTIPSIMVTGSHIPADRNGIKFNKSTGEILKSDEEGIRNQIIALDDSFFDETGYFAGPVSPLPEIDPGARQIYIERYLDFFPQEILSGIRLGVYQHSAVGRDILVDIFKGLGAEVIPLGRSDRFIPVDTEAIREKDVALAARWCGEQDFFSIVSTDGDSDRPLISDEKGNWLRGDVAGILAAQFLEADSVSTPISCNSALEECGHFAEIRRTRIGSPYVVEAMNKAVQAGARMAVGYEANGGFLTNSPLLKDSRILEPLPTRDAVIVHLSVILLARKYGVTISQLIRTLPNRYTASDRLKEFALERSSAILDRFRTGSEEEDRKAIGDVFGDLCGEVASIDRTDGIRITFENREIVHLRPSGNAPEFRCYTEASTNERAAALNGLVLEKLRNF